MELLKRPLLSDSKYQYTRLNSEQPSISTGSMGHENTQNFEDFEYMNKKLQKGVCSRCFSSCLRFFRKNENLKSRNIWVGRNYSANVFPQNQICNQKYNFFTFLPGVLYNQFKYFLNLYFLVLACSQFFPTLKIGYLYTYWLPLGFVLTVTLLREAYDEIKCHNRDKEINFARYYKLQKDGSTVLIPSCKIQVSDVIILEKNQRVPADIVLLRTSEKNGTCFIRTDQMDGETDWKLRVAVSHTQALTSDEEVMKIKSQVYAEKPHNDIHSFIGTFTANDDEEEGISNIVEESLNIENTAWANTVIASGSVVGVVIYTGRHTRSSMNTSTPSSKTGLLDDEINTLTKILFIAVIILSFILIAVKGFDGPWHRYMFRFIILFSYIIPISLRVNLDLGKAVYTYLIQKDKKIPGTLVRTSTLAEELGRINYLLCDKTGTLTQNNMIFKRLHLGTISYSHDTMDEVQECIRQVFTKQNFRKVSLTSMNLGSLATSSGDYRSKRAVRTMEAVKAIAICHNVTPVYDDINDVTIDVNETSFSSGGGQGRCTYQASSPDEIALVEWTESVGIALHQRDINSLQLKISNGDLLDYRVLQIFPFTSENKRMGIIVEEMRSGQITFYVKGADAVMSKIVQYNDWLSEECDNMAREGLRTLVVARKVLSASTYADFENRYNKAKCDMINRNLKVAAEIESLEREMELLCLTGVEDKLQTNVKPTLEMLSNAGIKVDLLLADWLVAFISILDLDVDW